MDAIKRGMAVLSGMGYCFPASMQMQPPTPPTSIMGSVLGKRNGDEAIIPGVARDTVNGHQSVSSTSSNDNGDHCNKVSAYTAEVNASHPLQTAWLIHQGAQEEGRCIHDNVCDGEHGNHANAPSHAAFGFLDDSWNFDPFGNEKHHASSSSAHIKQNQPQQFVESFGVWPFTIEQDMQMLAQTQQQLQSASNSSMGCATSSSSSDMIPVPAPSSNGVTDGIPYMVTPVLTQGSNGGVTSGNNGMVHTSNVNTSSMYTNPTDPIFMVSVPPSGPPTFNPSMLTVLASDFPHQQVQQQLDYQPPQSVMQNNINVSYPINQPYEHEAKRVKVEGSQVAESHINQLPTSSYSGQANAAPVSNNLLNLLDGDYNNLLGFVNESLR